MKLVDILARELKVWPKEVGDYCCCAMAEGQLAAFFGYRPPKAIFGGWSDIGVVEHWFTEEPEDRLTTFVTREQWQAAVDALNKPALDWSKAPEGATHAREYAGGCDFYRRTACGVWQYYHFRRGWSVAYATSEADCVARPPAAWNGEGSPPVGAVCEFSRKGCGNWGRVEILYVGKQRIFFRDRDGDELSRSHGESEFRPIRTAEQIAADERELAITDMCVLLGKDPSRPGVREMAGVLFDAGYRKQVAQ
ncbi:hypothetical protein V2J83_24720 [Pseudomonas alliivorans]|nr:hypothetical protein [Pseudomonas alliivorans]